MLSVNPLWPLCESPGTLPQPQIVIALQIHPQLSGVGEITTEAQRGIAGGWTGGLAGLIVFLSRDYHSSIEMFLLASFAPLCGLA